MSPELAPVPEQLEADARFFAAAADGVMQYGEEEWIVAHRFQDERSGLPPDARIGVREYAQIKANFNPQKMRVAVKAGWLPGQSSADPSHYTYNPPVGEVVDVDHDRINLWCKVRGIKDPETGKDRLQQLKAHGFTERSIGIMTDLSGPQTGETLFHLALLSMGNLPKAQNMPRLSSEDEFTTHVESIAGHVEYDGVRCYQSSDLRTQRLVFTPDQESAMDPNKLPTTPAAPADPKTTLQAADPLAPSPTPSLPTTPAPPPVPATPPPPPTQRLEANEQGEMLTLLQQISTRLQAVETKVNDPAAATAAANAAANAALEAERRRTRLQSERERIRTQALAGGRLPAAVKVFEDAIEWDQADEKTLKIFAAGLETIAPALSPVTGIEVRNAEGKVTAQLDARTFHLSTVRSSVDHERATLCAQDIATGYGADGKLNPSIALATLRARMHGLAGGGNGPVISLV